MSRDLFAMSSLGPTVLQLGPHEAGIAIRIEAEALSVLVPISRAVAGALGRRLVELAAEPPPATPGFPFPHRTLGQVLAEEGGDGS